MIIGICVFVIKKNKNYNTYYIVKIIKFLLNRGKEEKNMKLKKIAVILMTAAISIAPISTNVYATENVEIDESQAMEEESVETESVEETPEAQEPSPETETPAEVAEPQEDYQTQPDSVGEEQEQTGDVQQQVKKVSASETEWKIDTTATINQVKQIDMYVTSGTMKLEVFYSANQEKPEIIFKSASGNLYQAGTDVSNDSIKFKTVPNIVCTNFPELHYDVIYISNAIDPGNWIMQISVVPTISDLLVVEASVDPEWETLNTEYKTPAKNVFCWYFRNEETQQMLNSKFSVKDVQMIFEAEESPATNHITDAPEEEPEEFRIDWITVGLIAAIIALIVVAIIVFKKSKKMNDEYLEEKHKSNLKTNKKLKGKKQKEENDDLDSALDEFADEYEDYDMDEYSDAEKKEENEYFDEEDDIDEYEEKIKNNKKKKKVKKQNSVSEPAIEQPINEQPVYQSYQEQVQQQVQQVYQQPQPIQQQPIPSIYYNPVMAEDTRTAPVMENNLPVNASGKRPGWIISNAAKKKPAWVDDINDIRNYFF